MYIPLLTVAHGLSPTHCENTQPLREAITEDDDDDDETDIHWLTHSCLFSLFCSVPHLVRPLGHHRIFFNFPVFSCGSYAGKVHLRQLYTVEFQWLEH